MRVLLALAIWCAGLGAAAQFGKMSVLYDQLGLAYPAHQGVEIGILISLIGTIGLIFGTTSGRIVMARGPRRVMLGALILGAVVSLLQSLMLPYPVMLATRIPEGISHLAIVVVGPTAIAATATPRWQGLVMTLWGSFFGLTFTVLGLYGPEIAETHGIGRLFQYHAIWLLLCAAGLWLLMPRDPPRPDLPQQSLLNLHLTTYRSPTIAAPALGFVCYTVTYVAILTLLPHAVQPAWSTTTAVAMPLVSILVSLTLGVFLLRFVTAVRLVQIGFAITILAALGLFATWGHGPSETIFACVIAASMGIAQGASFAAIPQLNPSPEHRALAAGAIAQLGNLGTTTGTPMLALIIAASGITGLTLFLITFSALGIALHHWQARRRI
jgi:MFS transporter, DHA1 family, inner membrane transport protein